MLERRPLRRLPVAAALAAAALATGTGAARAGEPEPGKGPPPSVNPSAIASPVGAAPAPDTALSVHVITMGPGSHPFFKFGHDAIWIRDREKRTDLVYNFGTFSFDSPRLIFDFLGGRLTYWLSVTPLRRVLAEYQRENRSIELQELALAPEVARALQARLDDNARPEKRAYKYDYFLDNCATRVRDAVDASVEGRLRESARAPGRLTLRGQALRLTADTGWFVFALDVVLGPDVDRPIDRWAEMFIPGELALGLRSVTAPGPAGPRPLVAREAPVFSSTRPAPLEAPPSRVVPYLAVGLGMGLVFLGLGWAAASGFAAARALLGALVALWGLLVGFIGCFLVYAWAFTDHVVTHRNQNVFLFAPWAIALAVLGIGVALGRPGAIRKAHGVIAVGLAAAIVACVLKLGLAPRQQNSALIALFLPTWLGLAAAFQRLRSRTRAGRLTAL